MVNFGQLQVDDMKVYWSEPWQQRIMRCTLTGADLERDAQRPKF